MSKICYRNLDFLAFLILACKSKINLYADLLYKQSNAIFYDRTLSLYCHLKLDRKRKNNFISLYIKQLSKLFGLFVESKLMNFQKLLKDSPFWQ